MKKNNWGGRRDGAGRTALEPSKKKKCAKIYIRDNTKMEIVKYGKGDSFSEKVLDLVLSEIEVRKNNELKGDKHV